MPRPPEPVAVAYAAEPDDTEPVQLATEKDIPNGDFKETKSGTYQTPIRLTNGKTVYVRGYYRRDGTYVAPHMRSDPGTAIKSGGTRHRR